MSTRSVKVDILGNAESAKRAFREAGHASEGFHAKISSSLGGFAKMGAGLALGSAGFEGMSSAITTVSGHYLEHEKLAKQTDAVITSTGGAAHVTAAHVDALASSIEGVSGVEAGATKNVENLLLTFTNIKNAGVNKTFDQATQAVTDMSVALGEDPKSAAIQLGKALNDPVKGITALSRVGVSFSAQQKALIKGYEAHGKGAKAQAVILKELTKEFGGSAKAAGETLGGKMAILKGRFLEFTDGVIAKLMPSLMKLADWLGVWVPIAAQKVSDVFNGVVAFVRGVWARWGDDIIKIGRKLFSVLEPIIRNGLRVIVSVFKIVGDLLQGHWGAAWAEIKKLPGEIFDYIWSVLKGYVSIAASIASSIGGAIWDGITGIVGGIGDWLGGIIRSGLNHVIGLANDAINLINSVNPFSKIPTIGLISGPAPAATKQGPHGTRLAGGGVVTRPTLALIGEAGPEAVVPLSRGGLGGTTIIHVHVAGSVTTQRDLERSLIEAFRRRAQSGGKFLDARAVGLSAQGV